MGILTNGKLTGDCVHWASPDVIGGPSRQNPQDGIVDGADIEYIIKYWGECRDNCCRGDINRDGWIDELDLIIVINEMRIYDSRTFERCRESSDPDALPCVG